MVFNNEIGFGHFKLEFLSKKYDKSFEIIAAISPMIELVYLNTNCESFLLQVLTYLLNFDVKNVDKMEVLGKMKLRDEASTFTDWVKVILNEAYFELHENDFGF